MEKSSSSLPHDVFLEIMKRVPMEFMGKFRLLSKECNKSTHHSYFKNMHSKQTKTTIGFFLQSMTQNCSISSFVSADSATIEFPLNFLKGDNPTILAVASHGLMLCETESKKGYRIPIYSICKPAIRDWKKLPNPKTRFYTKHTAMVVMRSNPLHFKIVRLSKSALPSQQIHSTFQRLFCEIFDSKTWRWKRLDDVVIPFKMLFSREAAVLVSGAAYWRFYDDFVFEFQFDSEKWSIFPMPDSILKSDAYHTIKLAEYEGKLALMFMKGRDYSSMEIWQYEKKVWNKKIIISNEHLIKMNYPLLSALAFLSSDIAVMWVYNKLIYSKFEKESYTISQFQCHTSAPTIFPFWSDYEPLELGGGEEA